MLLFLSVTSSFAQENQTFFKRNKSANENSFDGALYIEVSPIIEASIINKEWGINLGGKGAVIVNQKWAVGGIGKGLVSENSFLGYNLDGEKEKDNQLNINYGAGGLFVEYYLGLDRAFHLSFPLHVMAGGISLKDEQKNTTISVSYNEDVAYYLGEKNKSGEFSLHRSVSKPKINYAFVGGLYAGIYDVKNLSNSLEKLNKKYVYHGGIVRAKVAYNTIRSPNFHWRVIGIQGSWYLERGPFLDFKNDLINTNSFDSTGILKHGTQTIQISAILRSTPTPNLFLRLANHTPYHRVLALVVK